MKAITSILLLTPIILFSDIVLTPWEEATDQAFLVVSGEVKSSVNIFNNIYKSEILVKEVHKGRIGDQNIVTFYFLNDDKINLNYPNISNGTFCKIALVWANILNDRVFFLPSNSFIYND